MGNQLRSKKTLFNAKREKFEVKKKMMIKINKDDIILLKKKILSLYSLHSAWSAF